MTSSPRPGTYVPGAGTVIGPGPDPGTTWAVPDDPTLAGTVIEHGRPTRTLTRAEQSRRRQRADRVVREGAVLAVHDIPDGTGPSGVKWTRRQVQVHVPGCEALTTAVGAPVRVQRRADVADAALRGTCYRISHGIARKTAAWCPTCLGKDGT